MLNEYTCKHYKKILADIKSNGLWKEERVIVGPQQSRINTVDVRRVVNLCANNYLGLANHPRVVTAAKNSYEQWGYGLASVRFICGTQLIHKELEKSLSRFIETEDTILYSSCFDANTGLFETLLTAEDVIISDELNHASIIDGIRLCKAKKAIYRNKNMEDLEEILKNQRGKGKCLIATDGVFSMDGTVADLSAICDLADQYEAMVMVDDSHAVGFMGRRGRGSHEHCGVMNRVDILTGTLGKALGGASGGYVSGKKVIIDLLRQRSRPYLFSNTLAPAIVASSLEVLKMLTETTAYRDQLVKNTQHFRKNITDIGFEIIPGEHPIVPIMLGDAMLSQNVSSYLLKQGVYVVGFFYPVVPQGKARIRTQISAAHTKDDLDRALRAFSKAFKTFTKK